MKPKFILLPLFLSLLSISVITPSALAQPLMIFEKTWGGSGSDSGRDITLDPSGNIIITGVTYSFSTAIPDVFLLKHDPSGNLLWQRTWSGARTDEGLGVAADSQHNIYVTGATDSFVPREADAFLLKFDPAGNLLWQKTWGGNAEERGESLAINGQGDIYVAGTTRSTSSTADAFLVKFDSQGNLLWQRTSGWRDDDFGRDVAIDPSGSVYITGYWGAAAPDIFLAKFSQMGDLVWQRSWGGSRIDYAFALTTNPSGDAYVTGYTTSYSAGSGDPFLLRIDMNGNMVWQRTWGGKQDDEALGVSTDPAGNVFIAGFTDSFGAGGRDVFLAKFDSEGSIALEKTWGGAKRDWGYGLAVDSLGSAYVTGLVAEGPPYALGSPSGTVGTPTFSLAASAASIISPTFAEGTPTGVVTTPSGSETYVEGVDVFLFKYGSPSIPTTTTTTTTTMPATTTTTTAPTTTTTTTPATTTTTPTPTPVFNNLTTTTLLTMATLTMIMLHKRKKHST